MTVRIAAAVISKHPPDTQLQSFSSLLSSIGDKPEAPKPSPSNAPKPNASGQAEKKPNGGGGDRFKLTPNNAAAGVKRRSEEPEASQKQKQLKVEQNAAPNRPAAPTNRFQLSGKPPVAPQRSSSSPAVQRSATANATITNSQKATAKPPPTTGAAGPSTASSAAGAAKPKGFAAMLAKAKEAQEAAKAQGGGGIQHKAAEKLSRREREKLREKLLAKEKATKSGQQGQNDRSRSGTPVGAGKPGAAKKAAETSYKGTMKKPTEKPPERQPLAYKGTMRPAGSAPKPPPKKGEAQDKYGGYASWSDLDDAEDEEEEGYYDDSDDDMEGGFDDLEQEESAALKAARKEDQEALEEEERLKREKLERKKKLMALSKNAAGRKKF